MTMLDEPAEMTEVRLLAEVEPARRGLLARVAPLVLGLAMLATAGGAGTWAAFTASTDNEASVAAGTLVLSNQKTSTTACLSTKDGGVSVNQSSCEQAFAVTVAKPGDSASATITLENVGTLDASALKVHAAGACTSAAVGSYSGSTDLCTKLRLSIQEYSDSTFATASACLYGGGTATTCAFTDPVKTVSGFIGSHGDWSTAKSMGAMAKGAGSRRYVSIAVKLDESAGNDVQGRQASFGVTWRIEQ